MESSAPRFGPYQTQAILGQGGMGRVYLARHTESGTQAALKVLTGCEGASDAQKRRFQREIRALGQVRHPGIVEILDAGEERGLPWFAMRHVAGGTLNDRIRKEGGVSPEAAIDLGLQLCVALGVVHSQGILHRDLKPDNVLCQADGTYLIADFGLAKDLSREASVRLSQTGALQGTPGYWAPEQAQGSGNRATPQTDVYGVGAVLYAAVTGVPPIVGESLLEISVATQERPPTPPSSLASVPRGLEAVILRCLAKAPVQRYQSMGDLEAALRRVQAGGGRALPGLALAGVVTLGIIVAGALTLRASNHLPNQARTPPAPKTTSTRGPDHVVEDVVFEFLPPRSLPTQGGLRVVDLDLDPKLAEPPLELGDLELRVRVTNKSGREQVLSAYLDLEQVLDESGARVPPTVDMGAGGFSVESEACPIQSEGGFVVIPPGGSHDYRLLLSWFTAGGMVKGWKLERPGRYRFKVRYAYSAEEARQAACTRDDHPWHDDPASVWNRAFEGSVVIEGQAVVGP